MGIIYTILEDLSFSTDIGPLTPPPCGAEKNPDDFLKPMFTPPNDYSYKENEWYTPDGGMSKLIKAMVRLIPEERIQKNSSVQDIQYLEGDNPKVKVTINRNSLQTPQSMIYDKLIVTIPSPNCDWIDWLGFKTDMKKYFQAFRGLSYQAIYKIALSFRQRFWQNSEIFGEYAVVGGQTQMSLPSKQFIFPSYGYEGGAEAPGTILVYNEYIAARAWGGQTDSNRINRCMDDLNTLFNAIIEKNAAESGDLQKKTPFEARDHFDGDYFVQNWLNVPSIGLSAPKASEYIQLSGTLMSGLDNSVYFAGEHLSIHHAWILGCLTSAGQAVRNMVDGHSPDCRKDDPILHFLAYREGKDGLEKFKGNRIPNLDFHTNPSR